MASYGVCGCEAWQWSSARRATGSGEERPKKPEDTRLFAIFPIFLVPLFFFLGP